MANQTTEDEIRLAGLHAETTSQHLTPQSLLGWGTQTLWLLKLWPQRSVMAEGRRGRLAQWGLWV